MCRATAAAEPPAAAACGRAVARAEWAPPVPRPRDQLVDLAAAERRLLEVLAEPRPAAELGVAGEARQSGVGHTRANRAVLAVLRACAGRGDVPRAEAWLEALSGALVPVGIRALNAVLHACARAADVKRGERWLLEIIDRDLEPDTFSFNTLLAACAEAGDVPAAHRWFARMSQAGMLADAVTYRTMLAACSRAGNAPLAEEWLVKMRRASHPPDIVSCSALVAACAAAGDPTGAERWLLRLQEEGLVAGRAAYEPVVRAWIVGGPEKAELGRAEGWLWKALEAGVQLTDAALVALLASFVHAEDYVGARRVAVAMRRLGRWPLPAATAALARPAAAAGDFLNVEELLADLRRESGRPDAACWRTLLAAYARAPRPPQDGRVEACFAELHLLGQKDGEVLGDLRRALGRQKYEALARRQGLCNAPVIHRHAHAKNRVVGRVCEVAALESAAPCITMRALAV